jgi:hypothetical protein
VDKELAGLNFHCNNGRSSNSWDNSDPKGQNEPGGQVKQLVRSVVELESRLKVAGGQGIGLLMVGQ